jgi:type II secretory pathway component PulK
MKNLYVARGATIYAMNKVTGVTDDDDDEYFDDDDDFDEDYDEFDDDPGSRNSYQKKGASSYGTVPGAVGGDKGKAGIFNKEEEEEQQPWLPSLSPYSVFVGGKDCKVYIEDESGKININVIHKGSRELLIKYLIGREFNRLEANTIMDSVLDWRDGNELKHINGAESDYYGSLPEPYEAKNAPFDTIEEFVLIKGMTPAKFDMIRRDITIYGSDLAININFASKEVLMAIPRITSQGADYIIEHREKKGPFKSMEDVRNSFWHLGIVGSTFEEVRPYITVVNSGYMTIRATCEANGVSGEYRAIISKVGNDVDVYAVYPD